MQMVQMLQTGTMRLEGSNELEADNVQTLTFLGSGYNQLGMVVDEPAARAQFLELGKQRFEAALALEPKNEQLRELIASLPGGANAKLRWGFLCWLLMQLRVLNSVFVCQGFQESGASVAL